MPNYIQDPNNPSSSQIPGPPPDNYYDRLASPSTCSFVKTPNYVVITQDLSNTVGFFFGSSASFAIKASAAGEAGNLFTVTGSQHYHNWGNAATLNQGDKLDIHPTAWSGSKADVDAGGLVFVYKGGLDGSGRP